MINPADLYGELKKCGVNFYSGVPDSLLKDFNGYLSDHVAAKQHVVAANEGGAIAAAVGHYLATGNMGLVYMQNSGLGNATNPLLSLADAKVYGVPVMMLVGWRGEPGVKDEPQHSKQGEVTLGLLQTLGVPCEVIDRDTISIEAVVSGVVEKVEELSAPVAIVVREGTFAKYEQKRSPDGIFSDLTREAAIEGVLDGLSGDDVVVSTTGKASRELYEIRMRRGLGHDQDFLTVGSMGHASQIALGIALSKHDRRVICIDGDGAVLMHMGSLVAVGSMAPENFRHIVLNNGVHDSVGGQPTVGSSVDFPAIALACGYRSANRVNIKARLEGAVKDLFSMPGPVFLEVRVRPGARKDLGRPVEKPAENKHSFMEFLNGNKTRVSSEGIHSNKRSQGT